MQLRQSDQLTYAMLKKSLWTFQELTRDYSADTLPEIILTGVIACELVDCLDQYPDNEKFSVKSVPAIRKIIANHVEMMRVSGIKKPYDLRIDNNLLCLQIAVIISRLFSYSRMGILFPTLQSYESVITSTDLRDDMLCLSDIVLSDDGRSFIEVKECLLTAVEDGELKHTQLLQDGLPVALSEGEKSRVINHSDESREYYEAIRARYDFLHDGTTLGASLQHLIEGLLDGGSRRMGEEMNAGECANLAILEFSEIYAELPEAYRVNLDLMEDSNHKTFRHYWEILAVDQQIKIDKINRQFKDNMISPQQYQEAMKSVHASTQTCVEITSSGLQGILKKNKALLFSMKLDGTFSKKQGSALSAIEENVRNKEHWFKWRLDQEAKLERMFYVETPRQLKFAIDKMRSERKANEVSSYDVERLKRQFPSMFSKLNHRVIRRLLEIYIWENDFKFLDENILPHLTESQRRLYYQLVIDEIEKTKVKQLSASASHTLYLTNDGSVYGSSNSSISGSAVLGLGDESVGRNIVKVKYFPSDVTVSQIASSDRYTLFLTTAGTVYGTGSNQGGQLGPVLSKRELKPVLMNSFPPGSVIAQISASNSHSLFLTSDGRVYGYGSSRFTRFHMAGVTSSVEPIEFTGFPDGTKICSLAAGENYSLFLTSDGQVYVAGDNISSVPQPARHYKPKLLTGFAPDAVISQIAIGSSHALFLSRDGQVYGMGTNLNGQLGADVAIDNMKLVKLTRFPDGTEICQIAAGMSHSLFVARDGNVYGCGSNKLGQLGLGGIEQQREIALLAQANTNLRNIVSVAAGDGHSVFLDADGLLYASGLGMHDGSDSAFHFFQNPRDISISPLKFGRSEHQLLVKYRLLLNEADNSIAELSRLSQTCKTLNRIFKPKVDAALLLNYVINADYPKVYQLLMVDYMLMFEKTKGRDVNGEEIWMSPLQYAFYVHDLLLQKEFFTYAECRGDGPKYFQQAAEVTKTFDFSIIKNAYKAYLDLCHQYERDERVMKDGEFVRLRQKIGLAQRHHLPRHILKNMCKDSRENLLSDKAGKILGIDFAVVHGAGEGDYTRRDTDVKDYIRMFHKGSSRRIDDLIASDSEELRRCFESSQLSQRQQAEIFASHLPKPLVK